MIVHETQPFFTRIGGEWSTNEDGKPILVGGEDVLIQPPPEHHMDDCPCMRCEPYRAASITISEDQEGEPPPDPEMTPEDIERLRRLEPGYPS